MQYIHIQTHFLISLLLVGLFPSCVVLQATPNSWQQSDYKATTLANYKNNPKLNQAINLIKPEYRSLNAAIFYETNHHRKIHGLSFLNHNPNLEKMAFQYSKTMVAGNFFSHTNPHNGSTTQTRATKAGILNPRIAENIATNFGLQYEGGKNVYTPALGKFSYHASGTPHIEAHTYLSLSEALLIQWMNSPSHRQNILSNDAIELGCGAYVYLNQGFNNMPMFKATQNFQFYTKVQSK